MGYQRWKYVVVSDPESRTTSEVDHISRWLLAPEPHGLLGDDRRVRVRVWSKAMPMCRLRLLMRTVKLSDGQDGSHLG